MSASDQEESIWTKFHVTKLLMLIAVIAIFKLGRWFFDPYFKYKNRNAVKDYECFFNGKIESKSELGQPYLLRD